MYPENFLHLPKEGRSIRLIDNPYTGARPYTGTPFTGGNVTNIALQIIKAYLEHNRQSDLYVGRKQPQKFGENACFVALVILKTLNDGKAESPGSK